MSELILKIPTIKDKKIIEDFKEEFIVNNEIDNMFGCGSLNKFDNFEMWLEKIEKFSNVKTCPSDRVPATQFISIRISDGKMIGMVNIRHNLNEQLLLHGGHIGDCVRPSERGKGYGTIQISLALNECKKLNINKILMTCDKDNIASAKTIQKNGGILQDEHISENGIPFQRYWIDLNNNN